MSRRSGLAMVEQDYQLRRARSQVDIPFGERTSPHPLYKCPSCEDPWVGRIHRSLSSSDLTPIRRPIVSPVFAQPAHLATWYKKAYKTPWYDRSKRYHWDGGYMSPHRYYPSPNGGYSYISSPMAPQLYYPNDWYHKFRSVPVGPRVDPAYFGLTTTPYDYDYLPGEALETGPTRAFSDWRGGRLDYSTLDRYWTGRDSLYRRLSLSNRYPHNYADYPFGSFHRRSRPWRLYP